MDQHIIIVVPKDASALEIACIIKTETNLGVTFNNVYPHSDDAPLDYNDHRNVRKEIQYRARPFDTEDLEMLADLIVPKGHYILVLIRDPDLDTLEQIDDMFPQSEREVLSFTIADDNLDDDPWSEDSLRDDESTTDSFSGIEIIRY